MLHPSLVFGFLQSAWSCRFVPRLPSEKSPAIIRHANKRKKCMLLPKRKNVINCHWSKSGEVPVSLTEMTINSSSRLWFHTSYIHTVILGQWIRLEGKARWNNRLQGKINVPYSLLCVPSLLSTPQKVANENSSGGEVLLFLPAQQRQGSRLSRSVCLACPSTRNHSDRSTATTSLYQGAILAHISFSLGWGSSSLVGISIEEVFQTRQKIQQTRLGQGAAVWTKLVKNL